jgi:hypothetical protein
MAKRNKHRDADAWGSDPVVEDGDPPIRVPMMVCDTKSTGWARPLTDAQVAERLAVRDGRRLRDQGLHGDADVDLSLHQPGFRVADQATRDKVRLAREEMVDRATSGWRLDKRRPPDDDPDDPDEDDLDRERDRRSKSSDARQGGTYLDRVRRPAIEAREAWVRSLSDAWRTPAATLAAPSPNRAYGLPAANAKPFTRDAAGPALAGPGPAATLSGGGVPDDPQKRRDAAWNSYKDDLQNAWRSVGPGPSVAGASASYRGPGA